MWIDDQVLKSCSEPLTIKVWIPESIMVVLGSSNSEVTEVYAQACDQKGVPVLRRYGGGGTVVLHPGCVVASVGLWVESYYKNDIYFERLNKALMEALSGECPQLSGLSQRGISDICWQDKKIAGTSMFRSRNYLLYQASILVDLRLDLIEEFLPHPSKEPDYRKGRKHSEFLAGLRDIEASLTQDQLAKALRGSLGQMVESQFMTHRVDPQAHQFGAILQRVAS